MSDDEDSNWEELQRADLDSEQLDAIENFMYMRHAWSAPFEWESSSEVSTLAPAFMAEDADCKSEHVPVHDMTSHELPNFHADVKVTEEGVAMAREVQKDALGL
eukprot:4768475-Pleurochrysis_carterae.AAC.1